jgi:glycosyltransferase involved in cell wall biosynthesis
MHIGSGPVPSSVVALLRISERVLLKRVDCVITVNEFISQELQRRYHVQRPRVILNVPKAVPQIEKLSLQPHVVKIALYQGRYARIRGLENLVRACQFLNKDVILLLRGYGEIEAELREIAKPFTNCRFEEPAPPGQLVCAASSADIGIVPYLPTNLNNYFASPNKLFEYIQAGLPVVASDLPFLRQIVIENEIGYLFDARSPEDIARSINLATRDESLRMLKSNVLKIRHRYSWEEEEKKLSRIYTDIELRSHHK